MKTRRKTKGVTLIETLMAASLTVMVLITSVSTFMYSMQSWMTGSGSMDAQGKSQRTVRQLSLEIREAMAVAVDGDGMGLTYRLPLTDLSGAYILPVTWDGVTHTVRLQADSSLTESDGTTTRTLALGVLRTDPDSPGGTSPYNIFLAGGGQVTQSITITVATQRNTYTTSTIQSRSRETIYLRNVPQISN